MKRLLKSIVNYFLRGIILVVPISATLYIIYLLLQKIDGIVPFEIPGLGLLTLFILLTVVGYLGSGFIAIPLTNILNNLLARVPLIKTVYTSIKDLLSAFVGKEKKFDQPVLVKFSKDLNVEKLGFITKEDLTNLGISSTKVAVYLPHSYAWSGNMYIVEREYITPIQGSSSEIIKFIISGGVSYSDKAVQVKK